jgi:hypothetical protein
VERREQCRVTPDLTLPSTSDRARRRRRHRETDRYQVLDDAFHERVRHGFLTEAAR